MQPLTTVYSLHRNNSVRNLAIGMLQKVKCNRISNINEQDAF